MKEERKTDLFGPSRKWKGGEEKGHVGRIRVSTEMDTNFYLKHHNGSSIDGNCGGKRKSYQPGRKGEGFRPVMMFQMLLPGIVLPTLGIVSGIFFRLLAIYILH